MSSRAFAGSAREPVRSRVLEDPLHGIPCDLVSEVGERVADPHVAPPGILQGHSGDEFRELAWCHRPASTSASTAVVLPGDQPAEPAENRVGCDNPGHLAQALASEQLAPDCKTTALIIRETQTPAAELLTQNPILFSQLVDQILLLTVQPSGQGEDEELQRVRHRRRLRARG